MEGMSALARARWLSARAGASAALRRGTRGFSAQPTFFSAEPAAARRLGGLGVLAAAGAAALWLAPSVVQSPLLSVAQAEPAAPAPAVAAVGQEPPRGAATMKPEFEALIRQVQDEICAELERVRKRLVS